MQFESGTKFGVTIHMNNENLRFPEAGTEAESFHCSKSGSVVCPKPYIYTTPTTEVWLSKWNGLVYLQE